MNGDGGIDPRLAARLGAEGAFDAAAGRTRNPYHPRSNRLAAELWRIGNRHGQELITTARARQREARERRAAFGIDDLVDVLRATA